MHLAWRLLAAVWVLLVGSSCATVGLHHWALDRLPRGEVVAFVDREGETDLVLVELDGEPGFEDGLWAFTVRPDPPPGAVHADPAPAPVRLPHEFARRARKHARRTGHVARLENVASGAQVDWVLLDVWHGRGLELAPGLAPRDASEEVPPRYYLSLDGKARDAGGARMTRVGLHVRRTVRETYDNLGAALLPPPRRVKARLLPAAVLAPLALAVDLVILPIEAVLFLYIAGDFNVGELHGDIGASFDA